MICCIAGVTSIDRTANLGNLLIFVAQENFTNNCFRIPVVIEKDVCLCCSANRVASTTDDYLPGTKKISVKKRRLFSLRRIFKPLVQEIRRG
jgi:hypothetical protein